MHDLPIQTALPVVLFAGGLLLVAFERDRAPSKPVSSVLAALSLTAFVIAFSVDQIWLSFITWSLGSWLCLWQALLTRRQQPGEGELLAPLFACVVSDATVLVGLLALQSTGTPMSCRVLHLPETYASLNRLDQAYWALSACGVLAGIGLRSALFPFGIWTKSISETATSAISVAAILLPVSIGMLLRFQPLYGPIPEVRRAMIGVGALTLVLMGLLASGQSSPCRRILYSMVSLAGLAWISAAVSGQHLANYLRLVAVCAICLSVQMLLAADARFRWVLPVMLLLLIGSGVTGQQDLFSEMAAIANQAQEVSATPADIPVEPSGGPAYDAPAIPAVSRYALPLGLLIFCLNISAGIFEQADTRSVDDSSGSRRNLSWILAAVLASLYVLSVNQPSVAASFSSVQFGLTTFAILGVPLAWIAARSPLPAAFWVNQDFYAGSLVHAVVTIPFQSGCRVVRFFDSLVVERIVFGICRHTFRVIWEACQVVQTSLNSHPDSRWSWAVLTVLVLSLATMALGS